MDASWHFPAFIGASLLLFVGVLHIVLRKRDQPTRRLTTLWVASVVVVGGMVFAKVGATSGFPIWLYYGLPAVLTWVLPPIAFRMTAYEITRYVPLALLVAPAIHIAFSFLLGWKEYMPFLPVKSLAELLG